MLQSMTVFRFFRPVRTSRSNIRTCQSKAALRPLQCFSTKSSRFYPRKDSQDKDSINTEATEYSKSGTDDEAARREDAAFDPEITDPNEQKDKAGEGHSVRVLSFWCSPQAYLRIRTSAIPRVGFNIRMNSTTIPKTRGRF